MKSNTAHRTSSMVSKRIADVKPLEAHKKYLDSTLPLHKSTLQAPSKLKKENAEKTTQKILPPTEKITPEEKPHIPIKCKSVVVEIDILEEEVYEDSVDSEPVWKEPTKQNNSSQVLHLILLFVGVFVGVSLSLYLIEHRK